jgi:hypothetical protein
MPIFLIKKSCEAIRTRAFTEPILVKTENISCSKGIAHRDPIGLVGGFYVISKTLHCFSKKKKKKRKLCIAGLVSTSLRSSSTHLRQKVYQTSSCREKHKHTQNAQPPSGLSTHSFTSNSSSLSPSPPCPASSNGVVEASPTPPPSPSPTTTPRCPVVSI